MQQQPFVSVVTPTYNRRNFIHAAIRCFKAQTYPQNRMEWIILDDGSDKVGDLFEAAGLRNVRYVAIDEKLPIGAKRNRLNEMARGDIVVAWDDDDFYPPERISRSVKALRSVPGYKVPMVGSSELYMYFADRDEIWSVGPYGQNHCTNGTMAYWRSYCKGHRYDDTATKGEEKVFLDGNKTSVIQLKPDETILVICHNSNTFDKRILLEQHKRLAETQPAHSLTPLRRVPMKLRDLVRDKVLREFYQGLR